MRSADRHWMARAYQQSLLSPDPSTKVGAVVVSAHGYGVGFGCNTFPPGVTALTEDQMNNRELKYKLILHAEARAVIDAGQLCKGGSLVTTMPCCCECAKLVIAAGIRCVIAQTPGPSDWALTRGAESVAIANTMFREAGVGVTYV